MRPFLALGVKFSYQIVCIDILANNNSVSRIRIRIKVCLLDPDPDPGGKKA